MEGDLYQRNLGNGIDPDEEGSPDGSGRGMIVDDQIDGELRPYLQPLELQREERVQVPLQERVLEWMRECREEEREQERQEEEEERELLQTLLLPRLSLPQRRLLPRLSLPQLVWLFNQGPTAAAVNGGELMTGGIQLYDGGVGRGDGIGNGFGANDQEQSSASINDEQPPQQPWLSLPQPPGFFNRVPASAAFNNGELIMTGGMHLYDGRLGRGDGIGNGFGANDQEQSSASINGEQQTGFFNRVPASAAVNDGELMTGGMHLYDGRVGYGDGIGNGFDANDQEQSSASINGELSTTYVRGSDYFRHVRTENGEVHFHMNSFVNVDGRAYNLMQAPHLNNLRSSQLINKVMLAITGQVGVALMFAALNDRNSPFPPTFYFVAAANAVGFITTLISMLLRTRKPWASGVLAKVGAVTASSAIILAMGMALHMRHIWAFLFLCIIAAVAVLFGHT